MSMLRLALYLLVTTLMIWNAQWTRISADKDIQGGQVAVAMREVLYGLSLYSLTHWANLTAATPAAITYTHPATGNLANVVNIFSPTADELMMMGFLASPTATSTTYPGLPWGGAGSYATAIAITPAECSGNACTTDLDVYWTQPVALSKGTFDVLLTSTVVNDSNISMGYTYPDNPALFRSSNATWSHGVPATLAAQAGLAMLHTRAPKLLLAARYPSHDNPWWNPPKSAAADLSTPLNVTEISDIGLVTSSGVPYFWTGSAWSPLNINANNTTFLGQKSGNTGDNSVFIGNLSGNAFYVEK
jgi:hypothetical protein